MNRMGRQAALSALILLFVFWGGCGKKEDDRSLRDEEFRVPDTLLAPKQAYRLTVDDYHPIRGGVMANDRIELHYPASSISEYVGVRIFGEALAAHATATDLVGRPARERVVVIGTKDMDEYTFLTRKEWWNYATIQGDTIICQPFEIMMQRFDQITNRALSEIGLTQRMTQMALDRVSAGALPIWLREALASYAANERPILRAQVEQFRVSLAGYAPGLDELEQTLHVAQDMMHTRAAYFFAYRMLERLLERATIEEVLGFARRLGSGESLDEASLASFGSSYLDLTESIRPADLFDDAGEVNRPGPGAGRRHGHG